MKKKTSAFRRELGELRKWFYRKFLYSPSGHEDIINAFHKFYYESGAWDRVTYLGVPTQKCPTDMWIYQELLYEQKPDVIIECGTAFGGSTLYLAHLLEAIGSGKVISIDINYKETRPEHPRIVYLTGSSTDPAILARVKELISAAGKVMVILDSDHSRDHVLAELRAYTPLVTLGSYLIVEDSNVNGHPADPTHGPGPMEALRDFLKENHDFSIDRTREKFLLTFNPNGYLRRIRSDAGAVLSEPIPGRADGAD